MARDEYTLIDRIDCNGFYVCHYEGPCGSVYTAEDPEGRTYGGWPDFRDAEAYGNTHVKGFM